MGWIGFDLDGTLANDQAGWDRVGEPIPVMVNFVKDLLAKGVDVRIVTARVGNNGFGPEHLTQQKALVEQFCIQQFGKLLPVTCSKDRHMDLLYDDRAIQVRRNAGEIIVDPLTYKP